MLSPEEVFRSVLSKSKEGGPLPCRVGSYLEEGCVAGSLECRRQANPVKASKPVPRRIRAEGSGVGTVGTIENVE